MTPTEQSPNEYIRLTLDNGSVSLHRYQDNLDDIILTSLYVCKNRKKGNGTALLLRAEALARGLCARRIFLQVKKNTWQKEWYKHIGYTFFENAENDLIWMVKSLK